MAQGCCRLRWRGCLDRLRLIVHHEPMIYAFTGPARKLTFNELALIRDVVRDLRDPTELRFGGAVGVDTAAAWNALTFWPNVRRVLVKPAAPWSERIPLGSVVINAPRGRSNAHSYMLRNDILVGEPTEVLVAFPETLNEELRSGTWATIRRANKRGITIKWCPLDQVSLDKSS